MKKIRIQNDIDIVVELKDEKGEVIQPQSLRNIAVVLSTGLKKHKVEDFTLLSNGVGFRFKASEQARTGVYNISVIAETADGRAFATDVCKAFELVACSCEAGGEAGEVETVTLDVEATFDITAWGSQDLSEYAKLTDIPKTLTALENDGHFIQFSEYPLRIDIADNSVTFENGIKPENDWYGNYYGLTLFIDGKKDYYGAYNTIPVVPDSGIWKEGARMLIYATSYRFLYTIAYMSDNSFAVLGKNITEDGGGSVSAGAFKIAGKLNIAGSANQGSYAVNDIKVAQNKLTETNEIAFYLITDAIGQLPSSTSSARVTEAAARQLQLASPNSTVQGLLDRFTKDVAISGFGVNVGDLIALTRVKVKVADLGNAIGVDLSLLGSTEVEMYQYKIICTNDAKPYGHLGIAEGVAGLMSAWDKTEVNKIRGIEQTVNNALPKNDLLPSRWEANMNNALQTGVYPWCTLGRPVGSTGAYTCIVKRTSTNDGSFDTIEQTAYGREGELGQVYKRIIFYKSDGTDTQYGDWIEVSRPLPIVVNNVVFTSVGYEPKTLLLNDMEDLLRRPVYVNSVSSKNRCFVALDPYEDKVLLSQRLGNNQVRISEVTEGLTTRYGYYNYQTQSTFTPSQMTKEEIIEVARVYPQLNIPI